MTKKELEEQEENFINTVDETSDINDVENNMFISEDFDEEFDSTGILTGEQYDLPTDADSFVDTDTGEVIKREDMTPWQIIKAIAKQNGTILQDPLKGCHHCYGRGYEGIDAHTKMPFPCRCLFRGKTDKEKEAENLYDQGRMTKTFSRDQKRRMKKALKNQFRQMRKSELRRIKNGLPPVMTEEQREKNKPDNREINKILKEYIKLDSLKKTAKSLDVTLSRVKNVVKNNKAKLEKMKKKGATTE